MPSLQKKKKKKIEKSFLVSNGPVFGKEEAREYENVRAQEYWGWFTQICSEQRTHS